MQVHSVMLGRAVMADPYLVSEVDKLINQHFLCKDTSPAPPSPSRSEALRQYGHYLTAPASHYVRCSIRTMVNPALHMFAGCSNAKHFKKLLVKELEATVRAGHTGPVAAGDVVLRVCDQLDEAHFNS